MKGRRKADLQTLDLFAAPADGDTIALGTTDWLAALERLADAGLLRRLDSALAAFVAAQDAEAGPELLVATAVLAQMEGRGNRFGRDRDGLIEQFRGRDARRLQGHEALENQCQRQDGARNQGPDGPARGLYDRQQFLTPLTIKSRGDYGPGRNSRRQAGEPPCPASHAIRFTHNFCG